MATEIQKPVIYYAGYDPGILTARWQADIPSGFTGFRIVVKEVQSGQAWNYESEAPMITIKQDLAPDKTYTLTVAITVDHEPVSTSDPRTLITVAPVMALVAYDPDTLSLQWAPVTAPGADTYLATLAGDGSTKNKTTDKTDCTFDGALKSDVTYSTAVRAQSSDGVVLGRPARSLNPLWRRLTSLSWIMTLAR